MSYMLTRRDSRVRPEPEHPEDVGARRHQAGLRGRHQVARQGALHRGGGQGSAQQGEHGGGGGVSGVEDRCQVSGGDVDEVQVGRDEREQPRERSDPYPALLLFFSRPPPPVPFCHRGREREEEGQTRNFSKTLPLRGPCFTKP